MSFSPLARPLECNEGHPRCCLRMWHPSHLHLSPSPPPMLSFCVARLVRVAWRGVGRWTGAPAEIISGRGRHRQVRLHLGGRSIDPRDQGHGGSRGACTGEVFVKNSVNLGFLFFAAARLLRGARELTYTGSSDSPFLQRETQCLKGEGGISANEL